MKLLMKKISTLEVQHILIIIAAVLLITSCSKVQKDKRVKKPNIIFIMSDDHAYQAISAYGSNLIETPNIDRIAKEGMLFTNACVTNSVCAPSRATILTGKHCHINGKIGNYFPFDTTQVTFPQIFQKNGYKTAMFGKLHFGNNPKGVDESMILPGQGYYLNPDFINKQGDTITIKGYLTDIITDLALDWLKKEGDEKPFMMMYLHKAPHRPWWPRADKFKAFTQKTFPEPLSLFDDYENRGAAAKTAEMNLLQHMMYSHDSKIYPETLAKMSEVTPPVKEYRKEKGFVGRFGRASEEQKAEYKPVLDSINDFFYKNWPKMTAKEKMKWKYQRYMQDYLGTVSSVDDNVGRLLDYLEESGLAENTIVVYTSDQGFFLGEHGWFDKRFIYNESFKTPLIIKWPGVVEPGAVEHEMVQNLDFAQTLLSAAGIDPPADMQGESIVPLLKNEKENWTREAVYYHYYEYPAVHMVKRHYGIVSKEYKLAHFYYDIDEWELYDRINDPYEMNNVYNDPNYSQVVVKLKKDLKNLRNYYKDSEELDQMYINNSVKK